MKIAFTLCSNNYLAQAHTLADSFLKFNPGYRFVIGLVDTLPDAKTITHMDNCEIIEVKRLQIPHFEAMRKRYSIIELNTAVKPFYFSYLLEKDRDASIVMYFDPDILFFSKCTDLENHLQHYNIVLTPHILSPINDTRHPGETGVLKLGMYNLGFIAVAKSNETADFLEWWKTRLIDQCLIDIDNSLFVDQLWINFVPIFYQKVYIEKNPGYNVAYWNLHERIITQKENVWFVNGEYPLIFFHYSGFDIQNPTILSRYQNRFNFETRKDVVPLFELYKNKLIENKFYFFRTLSCCYLGDRSKENNLFKHFSRIIKLFLPPIILMAIKSLRGKAQT